MGKHDSLMFAIPLLPLAGAAFNLIFGRHLSRRSVHVVAVGSVFAAFVVAAYLVAGPVWDAFQTWRAGGSTGVMAGVDHTLFTWIKVGALQIDMAFRIDTLSAVMILIVTFIGTLIHIYSTGYMADEPRYAAYFGYLNLFTGSMLILVLADNLPVMFIGWEGVGLCSYLLIGFWFKDTANADAGRKAFVVNRIGDFAFLLGMFLLFWAVGSLSFPDLRGDLAMSAYERPAWGGERLAMWAGLLLFIGACGKSAQIPLYVWLPDAMAGPTPVSALIHAATMVTAGVYMVARLSFLYASSTTAMAIVAAIGALTALFAAIMAFAQTDFKKVLAYSTVSQLGFMFVGVGVGAYVAGIFHLMTHAFFKAGLFLAAGSVMHAMSGSGDIMKMGGLRRKMPVTYACTFVFWLAICGIFPFAGFFSKDEVLAGAFSADAEGWWSLFGEALWLVLTLAALGTAFYMSRLFFLVFHGENRADPETQAHIHESPRSMTVPLVVLAAGTAVVGFLGLPHLGFLESLGIDNRLGVWLSGALYAPDPHPSGATLVLLMGFALAVGALGIFLGWRLYGQGPSAAVARWTERGFGARLHRVVYNKFYVDELYDLIIVRPFRWTARATFEFIDKFIIDLIFVNGSAFVVGLTGRLARWFQSGQVHTYLVAMVVGAALIFHFGSRTSPDFDYQQIGPTTVSFRADVGSGPAAEGATVAWDFDRSGEADATERVVTYTFGRPGEHKVTMWLTDGIFGKTRKVTRTVTVDEEFSPSPPSGDDAADQQGGVR
jgi:NADH-quinone oxidoreductase subunit L